MPSIVIEKEPIVEIEVFSEKEERIEIYRGMQIEMPYTKPEHGRILLELSYKINNWIKKESGFGYIYGGEAGIKFSEIQKYSFDLAWSDTLLEKDKIPSVSLPLMIEIISDGNLLESTMIKVEDYLSFGAKEVWLVFPKRKIIQVYYPNNTSKIFKAEDTITPGEMDKRVFFESK